MNRNQLKQSIRRLQAVIRRDGTVTKVKEVDAQLLSGTVAELQTEVETLNQIVTDVQAAAEALATERDSARMMYCEYDNSTQTKEEIAEAQGWGYLYAIPEA